MVVAAALSLCAPSGQIRVSISLCTVICFLTAVGVDSECSEGVFGCTCGGRHWSDIVTFACCAREK